MSRRGLRNRQPFQKNTEVTHQNADVGDRVRHRHSCACECLLQRDEKEKRRKGEERKQETERHKQIVNGRHLEWTPQVHHILTG
jgi:hypothetical protein